MRQSKSAGGRARWGIICLVLLVLGLVAYLSRPLLCGPAQTYDSLRLVTEALYEISQKFVWPKNEEEMIYGALRGLMNSLDPDSSFLTPQEYQDLLKGKKGPAAEAGLELIYKDNLLTVASCLEVGSAWRAGLRPGDHILKINGQMVRNLTAQEAARRFQGAAGASLQLQVLRNGQVKPLDLTVPLEPLAPGTVVAQVLPDQFGYIRLRSFTDDSPEELEKALKPWQLQRPPLRGLVLDLRNNARGTIDQAVATAAVLLGDKEVLSTKGRGRETPQSYQGKARDLVLKPALPLAVLVDQGTGRAAEALAGALRDQSKAVLLGAKTLGLCGLTRTVPLQDGSALVMTVAQCYTPGGQKIHGKGLEPEVPLETAPAGPTAKEPPRPLAPDQDPWVAQALEVLKYGKPTKPVKKETAS